MMRFEPTPEPEDFDERCRQPGIAWLESHPGVTTPRNYWSQYEEQLSIAFRNLCCYCVMATEVGGEVEHFEPWAISRREGRPEMAYEWSNFRYALGLFNKKKKDAIVLDPFQVENTWFRIHLPSLQLILTDAVPKDQRPLADFTVARLGLVNFPKLIKYRRRFFDLYKLGSLDLDGLREVAPLIAAAVERDLERDIDWRNPASIPDPYPES